MMLENQIATPQINHLLNMHLNAIVKGIEVARPKRRKFSLHIMDEMMDRDLTLRDLKGIFGHHQNKKVQKI